MEVILADELGFCYGVKRAVEMVLEAADGKTKVETLGPLIHNKQFIEYLNSKNIFEIDDEKSITAKKLVIRSHGIPKEIEERIKAKNIQIIDVTCPFVKKIHLIVERLSVEGYQIIILGDKKHPEVEAIRSYANKNPFIVNSLEELKNVKISGKCALVSQTTQDLSVFQEVKDYLDKNYPNVKVHNTICNATEKRQRAAEELAKRVDCMIIVGGKHSSNTTKLRYVCERVVKTYHIETEEEISDSWFNGVNKVGITAGASTPDFMVDRVIKRIKV